MAEGRGERTIGSGHLVALFLGIVVLCCVFFILGYEMGRAQFEHGGATASAAKAAAPAPTPAKPDTTSPGWPGSGSAGAAEAGKPAGSAPASSAAAKPASGGSTTQPATRSASSASKPPEIPKGASVLQVAANRSEADALGLAKILQDKGFPAFVLTPSTDQWYRVQVGPYADAKSAEQAKAALAKVGFNAIVKH